MDHVKPGKEYAHLGQLLVGVVGLMVLSTRADILINEINADSMSLDEKEFVELWNPGCSGQSLDGYTLVFFNGNSFPIATYRTVNLSGYCMEAQSYLVIGSLLVFPTPDIVAFDTNSVQNGLGSADAVALYKDAFVPTSISRQHLVDAVIYDKEPSSLTANYYPGLMDRQKNLYIHEDESALNSDESISRCTDQALSHAAFSVRAITPGAPNVCQTPGTGSKLCYDISEWKHSSHFLKRSRTKDTGNPFLRLHVRSLTECAQKCSGILACFRFSFSAPEVAMDNCLMTYSCDSTLLLDNDWVVGEKNRRP